MRAGLVVRIDNHFSIDVDNGILDVNSAFNYETVQSTSITVRASSGIDYIDKNIDINIDNVPEPPSFVSGPYSGSISEAAGDGATVTLRDVNINEFSNELKNRISNTGPSVTYSIRDGNDDGIFSIDTTTGKITKNSTVLDHETTPSYILTVKALNDEGYDTTTVTISIGDENDAPIASDFSITVDEDVETEFDFNGEGVIDDPDGDNVFEVKFVTEPHNKSKFTARYIHHASMSHTAINTLAWYRLSAYEFKYQSAEHNNQDTSFTYKIRDSNDAESDIKTVSITVNPVNDAPGGSLTITGTQREGYTLQMNNNITEDADGFADGDSISIYLAKWYRENVSDASYDEISDATNLTYTLEHDDIGLKIKASFSYLDAGDMDGNTGTWETVWSEPTDNIARIRAPDIKLSEQPTSMVENTPLDISTTVENPDSLSLTYEITGATWLSWNGTILTLTPGIGDVGTYTITLTVTPDNYSNSTHSYLTTTLSFTITVNMLETQFNQQTYYGLIVEESPVGTEIQIYTSDPPGVPSHRVSRMSDQITTQGTIFTLTEGDTDKFEIHNGLDRIFGIVSTSAVLSYEDQTMYTVTIKGALQSDANRFGTANINIYVDDITEPPIMSPTRLYGRIYVIPGPAFVRLDAPTESPVDTPIEIDLFTDMYMGKTQSGNNIPMFPAVSQVPNNSCISLIQNNGPQDGKFNLTEGVPPTIDGELGIISVTSYHAPEPAGMADGFEDMPITGTYSTSEGVASFDITIFVLDYDLAIDGGAAALP